MQFSIVDDIDDVERTVSKLEVERQSARRITLARLCDATDAEIWAAVTRPERLAAWFAPITGALTPGGRYQFEGNAGGTITRCTPPTFLTATWEFGGGISWVELRIRAQGASAARLELSHLMIVDDHWRRFGAGAAGIGWDLSLVGLMAHLSGSSFDQEAQNAFCGSTEGRTAIAEWSEAWRLAAVAAGEDPSEAGNAAERAAAFYTGEAVPT